VDTSKPFTVVTQFISSDGTASGQLKEIRRLYIQRGKKIAEANVNIPGIRSSNGMTDDYCSVQKSVFGGSNAPNPFKTQGGMKAMSDALKRGMVLAMSIWQDSSSNMGWLDSTFPTNADPKFPGVKRGPCSITSGSPADIMANNPDAAVVFSKIRVGDIGTTF
jgi:cellulose 1,4-beta-cellobiosidase